MTTEAEARYLEAVADDCRRILGAGIEIDELTWDDTPTRLTLRYRLDGWAAESSVTGTTVVEAHAALRIQLVADRLRLGFRAVVEPRQPDGSSATR